MKFASRILNIFGVAMVVGGIIYGAVSMQGDNRAELIGTVLMVATGVFFFFVALMLRAAPAMEYMIEHPETKIDRDTDFSAPKERLAPTPPPKGVHIPGPSIWPMLIAVAGLCLGAGLVFKVQWNIFVVLGVALLVIVAGGWFRQTQRETAELIEHGDDDEHAPH